MKTQATPRPWFLEGDSAICVPEWGSDEPDGVVKIAEVKKSYYRAKSSPTIKEYKANAELIVRAVNCHEDLIESVSTLINIIKNGCETEEDKEFILDFYEQLLKRAKGEM